MTSNTPPLRSALEQASSVFVRYPRLHELHLDIQRCQRVSRLAGEPQCMALEGVTGAGKSTLVQWYASKFERRLTDTSTAVPVLYVETPSPATIKDVARAMLESLGDPAAAHGTAGALNSRLVKQIAACGVELVILDDFHHLIDTETDRVLMKVSEWLKTLIKKTGVPYLVVGIEGKVERILRANAQLSRLFAARETLRPFQWDPGRPDTLREFGQFVATLEKGARCELPADLPRTELLYRLYYATDGVVGNLMNLFRYAMMLADERGASVLDLALLAQAFDKRLGQHLHGKANPFDTPAPDRFTPPEPPPPKETRPGRKPTSSIRQVLNAR